MTIFHAIKYPISDVPTVEQIKALPEDLFYEWAHRCGYNDDQVKLDERDIHYLCKWIRTNYIISPLIIVEATDGQTGVATLRKMIEEYDHL